MDLSLRSLRKNIAAFSVVALLASLLAVNVAFAAASDVYGDVDGSEWYAPYVDWGLDNGVLDDTQAYFRAGDNASRAEFFKMTAAAAGITEGTCDETLFPDLDSTHWACGWITGMAEAGIISGDGSASDTPNHVRPNDNITRAEAAKVAVEAFGLVGDGTMGADVFTDVPADAWYNEYMGIAAYNCVFQGNDGAVSPGNNIVRAEAMAVESRSANPTTECTLPTIEAGALTVAIDGSTPATVSIPQNGANIPYSVFKLSASADEDIDVEQLVITREGLGLPGDFTNLKLYVDGVQKGSEKTISTSTNTATFNLSSDPIVVPASSSVLVEVRADMSGVSGSENKLCIAMADDVLGTGVDSAAAVSVGGSFEACGEAMNTTSASVGTLTYTVSQPSTADINVGDTDVIMTKVRMDMATEDVEVNRITFKQTGSAGEEDFSNVSLWLSGSAYAENPSWEGDFLTFDLSGDPIEIAKGNTKTLELHTDIAGGLASTANFDIYRDWHIEGTGTVYGYGVNVTEDGASITPANRNIVGGNIAFSLSSNNPVTGDVKKGANDHDFTRFNISTGGDGVTVRKLSVTVNGTDFNDIDDVKVWTKNSSDEWYVVAGPNDITAGALPQTVSFTDTFDVPAATTQEFMITADIANGATATDVYDIDVASVIVAANTELEYLSDGTPVNVTTEVTGGILNGNVMTVNTPTLTVSLSSTPGANTYVRNTTDRDLVAFDMSASTADDVRVTGMTVTCTSGGGAADCATAFQSLYLYDKDGSTLTEIDGPRSMSASGANGTVTYSFNHSIDAGAADKLLVRGDLSSGAATGTYDFNVSAITAEDTDSSAVTVQPTLPLATARTVTVAGNGTLTNSGLSDSDVQSRILVGSSTDNGVMKIQFQADELEDWYVKKLAIVNTTISGQYNAAEQAAAAGWAGSSAPALENTIVKQGSGSIREAGWGTGGSLSYDNTAANADVTSVTLSYYVADDVAAPAVDDNFTLQFCTSSNSSLTAGTTFCSNLNGGVNVTEGSWVTETVDVTGYATAGLQQYYGLVSPLGGSDGTDTVYIDDINLNAGTNDKDVEKIKIAYNDGSVVEANLVNGVAKINFPSSDYLRVPAGETVTATVNVSVAPVTSSGQQVGDVLQLSFDGSRDWEAVGASSAATATATSVNGKQMRIAKGSPTVVHEDSTTTLNDSELTLYKWTVSADEASDIAIKQFAFSMTKPAGVTLSGFKLFANGSEIAISDSAVDIIGVTGPTDLETAAYAGGNILVQFDDGANAAEKTIQAGTAVTFELKATVAGSAATDDVITTLLSDSAGDVGTIDDANASNQIDITTAAATTTDRNFIWSDKSASPHNSILASSSSDWLDGWLVSGLSGAGSQTLHRN